MREVKKNVVNSKQICLLGASVETGNLGVSALAEASVKCIQRAYPGAVIHFLGLGRQRKRFSMRIDEKQVGILSWPVRFCPNILVDDHYWKVFIWIGLKQVLPFLRLGKRMQSTADILLNVDMIFDVTGGDSFSDLYGMKRFVLGYLIKRMCQMLGKPFVMLPQTYGPYQHRITRIMARRVLHKSKKIYSRDLAGVNTVRSLLKSRKEAKLLPDLAFVLDKRRPKRQAQRVQEFKQREKVLIGINVSGLLYHGGYNRDNQFGLNIDYPHLMQACVKRFLELPNTQVLLVPHVIPDNPQSLENDFYVCKQVQEQLSPETSTRVLILEPGLDQGETKYMVGQCDFFVGARMHATIAAMSQTIPAVGLAYSDKFSGVFATAGVDDCVLDMRRLSEDEILDQMFKFYQKRTDIHKILLESIPKAHNLIYSAFKK